MTHTVLIVTDETDVVAQRVAAELAGRGTPVVTIDTADFPGTLSMAATIEAGATCWAGTLTGPRATSLNLAEVGAVYWRRPTQFVMDERMSSPESAFAYGEARYGFGGILIALGQGGCLWVNDPMAAMRAEYKPVQLTVAAQVGLTVPPSIITNDPQAAHTWAKERDKPIIYKPMSGVWHADEGRIRALYTSPVGDFDELLDPAFARTAQLLQEQMPKAFEARAIVVGTKVFTVRIDASTEAGKTDWRSDYDSLTYTAIDLPEDTEKGLVKLHERLGLVYGASDLICTPSGEWVYLETNQRGEWFWLADETGLPIASALADILEEGPVWTR
ncbi:ATP-grasp ribosomal peptide maturase [Streptosporangium carneum]|uniref:ATP-grasp ribosomal peptide maturase n=1 Tax=Streptosporangium carneum TaxID=47481 RepID=A0A9W6MC33_9ACTN|nr:ATP-grasp ribosomal peptide maturase [Streptosporangium carneum]GLK08425.1 ATP-grasp ribosomal peptide maturase [Streptosporangium carneum]